MPTIVPIDQLAGLAGRELPASSWLLMTQERIDLFAKATNDHQFIHVDPAKAALTPFGSTIAHGFLSLSMLSYLNAETAVFPENLELALNYGSDKVRYLAPVKVRQRIRSHQRIVELTEKQPCQWLFRTAVQVEIEGEETPALVADILTLMIVGPS